MAPFGAAAVGSWARLRVGPPHTERNEAQAQAREPRPGHTWVTQFGEYFMMVDCVMEVLLHQSPVCRVSSEQQPQTMQVFMLER